MGNKITINTLSAALVKATGKSKKLCDDFIREFFRLAAESLQEGETLKIKDLGTFKITDVESRTGVNVNTGLKQEIPAYKKVVFTPSKELASAINAPFEEFETVEMEDEFPDDIFYEEGESEDLLDVEASVKDDPEIPNESPSDPGDENKVEKGILEAGSEEEGEDDEITLEAYETIEKQKESEKKEALESQPSQSQPSENRPPETQHGETKSPETQHGETKALETNTRVVHLPVPYYEPPRPHRFGMGFLVGALSAMLVCIILFMLGCFFDWWPVNFKVVRVDEPEPVVTAVSPVPVDTQSVDAQQEETQEEALEETTVSPVTEKQAIADNQENREEKKTQVEPVKSPLTEKVYDTVSTTRYLTTIAQDHYGDFNFWPYIYIENQDKLGHPNRITPGTKVVVPDLSKYGVDPTSHRDRKEAKKKGQEIYARYK